MSTLNTNIESYNRKTYQTRTCHSAGHSRVRGALILMIFNRKLSKITENLKQSCMNFLWTVCFCGCFLHSVDLTQTKLRCQQAKIPYDKTWHRTRQEKPSFREISSTFSMCSSCIDMIIINFQHCRSRSYEITAPRNPLWSAKSQILQNCYKIIQMTFIASDHRTPFSCFLTFALAASPIASSSSGRWCTLALFRALSAWEEHVARTQMQTREDSILSQRYSQIHPGYADNNSDMLFVLCMRIWGTGWNSVRQLEAKSFNKIPKVAFLNLLMQCFETIADWTGQRSCIIWGSYSCFCVSNGNTWQGEVLL